MVRGGRQSTVRGALYESTSIAAVYGTICSLVWGTMGAALNLGTRVPGNLGGKQKKKHGSLKFHGGEAWGRGVQGACGAYSGCILPSLVVSSLSRPRSLLIASCCLLFWRVFVRSLREHAGFKEGSLRRLRSFILAIFASKDGRRS